MMNRKGFTLVELMIVVAIIGILAAIAIPNFVDMQYRAKRAEVPSNVDGIKTAELAYEASFDTFVEETSFKPESAVNKTQRSWTGGAFDTLGWAPDGDVRGSYKAELNGQTDFTVTGKCDVDGDTTNYVSTASKEANPSSNSGATTY